MESKIDPVIQKKIKKAKKQKVVTRFTNILEIFYYSFPIQLLLNHIRANQVLLLCWILLFAIVTENFGNVFGIPYLFLDPEYNKEVNFWSFFIIGIALGGFIMAFHITCYIVDGPKFGFLGILSRPFTKFSINNAIIPTLFLIVYIASMVRFQSNDEQNQAASILSNVLGLLSGCFAMFTILFSYFRITNKDIFRYVAANVDKRLRRSKITRGRIMNRYKHAKKDAVEVRSYFDVSIRLQPAIELPHYLSKASILKVFDQNHLNSVIIETFALLVLLLIGIFRETPAFQFPAAASSLLLFTIFIMLAGAVSFWFKTWAASAVIILVLIVNVLVEKEFITKIYKAYGLSYDIEKADYSVDRISAINSPTNFERDKTETLKILENWKNKQITTSTNSKPKMIFVCSSGGGQRSALWTFNALQTADNITNGNLMRHTFLMTGASGGLIGASYYRELHLRKQQGNSLSLNSPVYLHNIAQDILNPIIFSLAVNDLFIRYQHFDYAGISYPKDRGYAFEAQLNKNMGGFLNKSLGDYAAPEKESLIPMMIISPIIVNDGRKLYISPHHVSYMNLKDRVANDVGKGKVKGIDFRYLFENHGADSLRFLTALRMNATFPYITPNVTLPTSPSIDMMDAGLSDNFGVSDALTFLSVFREWINENTSGVIILSLRDSEKNPVIIKKSAPSLFEKIFTPVRSLYNNWSNIQDINNDNQLELARIWFEGDIHRIDLEYITTSAIQENTADTISNNEIRKEKEVERASLSWHLTDFEKDNIIKNINLPRNQMALARLKKLLEE